MKDLKEFDSFSLTNKENKFWATIRKVPSENIQIKDQEIENNIFTI